MLFYCTRLESEGEKKKRWSDEKQAKKMKNEKISTGKYDSSDDLVAKMMALPPRFRGSAARFADGAINPHLSKF